MTTYGIPEHIRSDNGPEFIEQKVRQWLQENQIKTLYIDPGSPWQNATSRVSTAVSATNV
jgi:putative transposase